jgi:hypothetical protein
MFSEGAVLASGEHQRAVAPIELMEWLAAQSRVSLRAIGMLAPPARLRARAIAHDRPEALQPPLTTEMQTRDERDRPHFRRNPGTPRLRREGQIGLIVESGNGMDHGVLRGFRVADGEELLSAELTLRGIRFAQPLVHDDVVYVPSCETTGRGPSTIEALRISRR